MTCPDGTPLSGLDSSGLPGSSHVNQVGLCRDVAQEESCMQAVRACAQDAATAAAVFFMLATWSNSKPRRGIAHRHRASSFLARTPCHRLAATSQARAVAGSMIAGRVDEAFVSRVTMASQPHISAADAQAASSKSVQPRDRARRSTSRLPAPQQTSAGFRRWLVGKSRIGARDTK